MRKPPPSSFGSRSRTQSAAAGSSWRSRLAPLQQRWLALSARERSLTKLAAAAVAILLFWAIGLAPALHTLHDVQLRRGPLEAQQQRMLTLKAEAERLKAQPIKAGGGEDAARALTKSVQERLGDTAQLAVAGERATLTLRSTPAAALARWLAEARVNARALPLEARLTRTSAPARPLASAARIATAPAGNALDSMTARLAALQASGAAGGIAGGFPLQGRTQQLPQIAKPSAPPADEAADQPHWNGTLIMALPPQR
jgi:general secretion pathway protein M